MNVVQPLPATAVRVEVALLPAVGLSAATGGALLLLIGFIALGVAASGNIAGSF